MNAITLTHPWLEFDLGRQMQVLSWAVNRPGLVSARRILWREVRNADLSQSVDARDWLGHELAGVGAKDAVVFLTSCNIAAYTEWTAQAGQCTARCVTTVGLGNAERIGRRQQPSRRSWGTINIAVAVNCGLTHTALIEAVSIVTEARTTAILEAGLTLSTGRATGTGTDCIAVAAPNGPGDYAGLHTDVGEALGAAVYRATLAGARKWMADRPKPERVTQS